MREGRVEDVVERMTKKGKMRQERLRVLRQFLSERAARRKRKEERHRRHGKSLFPRTESGALR